MPATITLEGFIATQPETRYTPNGTPALNLTVPETPQKLNKDTGQWEDNGPTTWWKITLWGTAADNATPHLHKGTRVLITGHPQLETREHNGKTYHNPTITNAKIAIIPTTGGAPATPTQNAYAGGFGQPQGGTQPQGQNPQQGAPQADPWAQQAQGNYDWGQGGADQTPPF